jgi:hypothetical protein
MGLDMHLHRRHYPDMNRTKENAVAIAGILGIEDPKKIGYITEEVMYWRKANHIHKWFVDNIQDGNDDCGQYYVWPEKMRELLVICDRVIDNPELGPELLPTQRGFFFGDTQYDEYYMEDVKNTAEVLRRLIDEGLVGQHDFYYSSSW